MFYIIVPIIIYDAVLPNGTVTFEKNGRPVFLEKNWTSIVLKSQNVIQ